MQQIEINYDKLNFLAPIVVSDGHIILVSNDGTPRILFFQSRSQANNQLNADIVAAVQLNNLGDLKELKQIIDDAINKHQNKEK